MSRFARSFAVAGLFAALSLPVFAAARGERDERDHVRRGDRRGDLRGDLRRSVPEFDPATAGAIAAVIGGGGLLLARRKPNKPKD